MVLLAASYYFYWQFGYPAFLYLILISFITYLGGYLLDRYRKQNVFIFVILITLSPMIIGKYTNFFLNLFGDFEAINFYAGIGLSFYTFMAISYLADIYKNTLKVEHNLLKLAFYLSFFPHILQGPISKAKDFLPQLNTYQYNESKVIYSCYQIAWGIIQKAWIADVLASVINPAFKQLDSYNSVQLMTIIFLYALQIYTDFAGYSDIVIGVARLLGYELKTNFNHPYFAKSIAEFWRRWHITLGAWLREYVYIPLGGNRKGTTRKYINLMIVFLLSGFWHGASFNYVIWGLLHGFYQVFGSITHNLRSKLTHLLRLDRYPFILRTLQVITVFICVSFSWIFFRAPNLEDANTIMTKIFSLEGFGLDIKAVLKTILSAFPSRFDFVRVVLGLFILLIASIFQSKYSWKTYNQKIPKPLKYLFASILLCLVFFAVISGTSSVDSRFLYFDY